MPALVVPALVRSADPDADSEERNLRLRTRPRVPVLVVTQRTMVVQRRQPQPGLVVMAAARSWIRVVVCFGIMMLLSSLALVTTLAWTPPPSVLVSRRSSSLPIGLHRHRPPHPVVWFPLHAASNNNNNSNNEEKEEEDSDQDLWMNIPPPSTPSSAQQQEDKNQPAQQQQRKLGIDIGAQLAPLTRQEAAALSAAAQEIVNDAVAAGLDEIDALRAQMKTELQQARAESARTSAANAQRASAQLLNRIDALTENFLQSTQSERTATQRAAAADQASAGQGLEVGVWGTVGGVAVPTTTSAAVGETLLLGSVASSAATATTPSTATDSPTPRLLILADPDADSYARALVPAVTETLQQVLLLESNQTLTVELYKPTGTVPLGGNNAAAVVLFCTSFSDRSTVAQTLERVLRRTVSSTTGQVGTPPLHILAISTVGTAQTHKMPYSLQNLLTGGALEKRKQMEETIVRIVRDRQQSPPLDYTICKLGELRACTTEFALRPGDDEMEGTTSFLDPTTAATVVTQALALQPFARNATFSCVGRLPLSSSSSSSSSSTTGDNDNNEQQVILDDAFLRLDGPELLRMDLESATEEAHFGALVEYLREWAHLLAGSRGLTTPIQAQDVVVTTTRNRCPTVVRRQQTAVRVLFLPTNTGNKYRSKDEERERESGNVGGDNVTSRRSTVAKEGGVEFAVEVTTDNRMRVRVKRCNYGDDAVIKELSEKTILSRFRQSMEVWKKDHQQ